MGEQKKPCVCVMLASYNGEKYIEEQVDSILQQIGVDVKLVIRDDGSKDGTLQILDKYSSSLSVRIIKGQNLGPAKNFYQLLRDAFDADYYAWSDQDDIWDTDKMITGIQRIAYHADRPALYYSASQSVNGEGKIIGVIGADSPSLNFGTALVRSKAQGSTFVFNQALLEIAKHFTPDFKKCGILHDAWLHRTCLAVGGVVVHDPTPHMLYRIHGNNVMAKLPNHSLKDRITSFFSSSAANYHSTVTQELLRGYADDMSRENYQLAYDLANYRKKLRCKLRVLFSSAYKVGIMKEDLRFKVFVLLNKA